MASTRFGSPSSCSQTSAWSDAISPAKGLVAVRGICCAAPACAVVVLSYVRDVDDMLDAIRAGAVGYVPGAIDGDRPEPVKLGGTPRV